MHNEDIILCSNTVHEASRKSIVLAFLIFLQTRGEVFALRILLT